jgi:glyoxylase-like metal-dependent hydrolase (beta-lactamase superfamily II)
MSQPPVHVGDVTVHPLLDATVDYPWPLAQLFPEVPDRAWEPFRERYPATFAGRDGWRSRYHCYLLRSGGRTVLLDTGMGHAGAPLAAAFRRAGELPRRLADAGVAPADIDTVVLSHLHPDHVGGTLDANGCPSFPRARYLAPDVDWDTFHRPEVQKHFPFSFVEETLSPLRSLGVLDLITAPLAITDELTLQPAAGHTPGHVIAEVRSQGEQALLLVDAFLHPAQVTEPGWTAIFDMDIGATRRARRRLLKRMEAEDVLFAASHFPSPTFGRIRRLDGRTWWEPIERAD